MPGGVYATPVKTFACMIRNTLVVLRNTALILALGLLLASLVPAQADEIGCLDTTFRLLSPDDSVCVYAFDDPGVPGVSCHVSQCSMTRLIPRDSGRTTLIMCA